MDNDRAAPLRCALDTDIMLPLLALVVIAFN